MTIVKNKFFSPFLFIFLSSLCFSQSFEQLYKKGLTLYKENKYSEAEIYFRKALKFGTKKDKVHFLIGMCCGFQKRLDEAEYHFLVSLKINNRFEECYLELGAIYFKKKEYRKAEQMIKEALKINPENKYTRDFLATVYYVNGLTALALHEWNKINKPILNNIFIESDKSAKKEFLVKELCFNLGQMIKPSMIEESRKRLEKIGNISNISFHIIPHKKSNDDFDLQISFYEEKGFARNFGFFIINLLRDISQKIIHLDYKNISDININAFACYRFSKFRKKLNLLLTLPRFKKLPFYSSFNYTRRSETWNLSNLLPDQREEEQWIRTKEFIFRFDYVYNARISFNHYLKYKIREIGSDLNKGENELNLLYPEVKDIFLFGGELNFNLIHDLPKNIQSNLRLAYDISVRKKSSDSNFIKVLLTLENTKHWRKNLSKNINGKLLWRLKLGYSAGEVPLEEKFIVGIGPDTIHYLRAHNSTYKGKLGNSPVLDSFILSNLQYSHHLIRLFPFKIEGGVFIDFLQIMGENSIHYRNKFIVDWGIFSKIYLFNFPFVLSFGYNLKENVKAFYFGSTLKF